MKIQGTYTVAAARDAVWAALMSPEALSHALPGCEKFEPDPAGGFRVLMKVGIAAISGRYEGHVEIQDPVPPQSYRLKVEAKGTGGFVRGEGLLSLSEDAGKTNIGYSGEVQIGGPIAAAGQRLIQAATRQIVNQFFQSLAKQIPAAS
ncbi:MAG: SRPBCC family protein [Terriglobia bacterium]